VKNPNVVSRIAGIGVLLIVSLGALTLDATSASAQTFTSLYQFTGPGDGENPVGGLALDSLGNLYGTTRTGGAMGFGTVFELPSSRGKKKVLYSFSSGSDGQFPAAALSIDNSGNLYGTTFGGGSSTNCPGGCGTVFKLTKGAKGTYTESVVYSFTGGSDGQFPAAGMIFDGSGNLHGTTSGGGSSCNCGTVFELTKNSDGTYTESVVYSFTGGSDGSNLQAGLTGDSSDGNQWGTAHNGGSSAGGTIFELSPAGNGAWIETTLYAFNNNFGGCVDGCGPAAPLLNPLLLVPGSLFGTTDSGGSSNCSCGTVFEITNANGTWTYTVLYSFAGGSDGSTPTGALIADASGNLYGTTESGGGSTNCSGGCGTVFELAKNTDGTYTESVLHSFTASDGSSPTAGLIADVSGNMYGTTEFGGVDPSAGTVFKLTPKKGRKGH